MNPFAEHAAAIREVQSEMGDECPTLDWYKNGVRNSVTATIKILPGTLMVRSSNSVGGLSLDSDFSCTCLAEDFSEQPNTNQVIVYRGKKLAISSVNILAGGLQYQIKANDAAQSL